MSAIYDPTNAVLANANSVFCYGPLTRPRTPPPVPPSQPQPQHQDKPLPSLPSPTLTNPDMVLPHAGSIHAPDSPESLGGPPSITYLRDITNQHAGHRASMEQEQQQPQQPAKKEKRGLMSRKMMLLRSRTASSKKDTPQARQESPARQSPVDEAGAIASSPTIHEGDRLAPSSADDKRNSISASSFNSEEFAALPAFLSKYRSRDETEDEDTDVEKSTAMPMGYSCSIAGGADAQRKAQEEEEQNSAMLSQRAEQILANAKKRLNLMEGNLRGARDLVAPLTAANLKRATSLGSSPSSAYGTKRYLMDGYTSIRPGGRTLHIQTSTPALGREYHQGHSRTHSDNTLPERPHTALARGDMFGRKGRIPVRPSNSSWTDLRGSRSFESLGANDRDHVFQNARDSPAAMGTPDPDLGPLPEESASQAAASVRDSRDSTHFEPAHFESHAGYGLGISRPSSTTEDLKEQMSSLKGRISSLRERAKEDSLRRQSFNSLRNASPLNNAEHQAPGMWYAASPDESSDIREHDQSVAAFSPSPQVGSSQQWGPLPLKTGSRNAFAEMAAMQQSGLPTLRERRMQHNQKKHDATSFDPRQQATHPHRRNTSRDMPGSFNTNDNDVVSDAGETPSYPNSHSDAPTLPTPTLSETDSVSEYFPDNESVYEDAEPDLPSEVVPHEEREDAFDYEHFFLHSAMARYQQSSDPVDSDEESVSSVSTAKGPTATAREMHPVQDDMQTPQTPETPETLREIERKIAHSRSQSMDSVSTIASFATAAEHGRNSPTPSGMTSKAHSRRSSRAERTSRPSSTDPAISRPPSTTMRRPPSDGPINRRTSTLRRSQPMAASTAPSPLLSPSPMQDATTIAVNALLDPQGRCLGLKDKALVFSVVESLRKVCEGLQQGEDEEAYDKKEWRRRLDGCRRVLEGEGSE